MMMIRYRGFYSSKEYMKSEEQRPVKAYHGFVKLMQDEFGASAAEADAEWEYRKARPGQFRQDNKGWKGCLRVEAPSLGQIAEGEAEEKGFSAEVATRQKKKFSNDDVQATFKRMRTDMGKDEASDLGLFRDVKGPGQEADAGSAFDQAMRTPQRRHPTDQYRTAIIVVPVELVGMLPAALHRAHCHLRCLSPPRPTASVRRRPSSVRPPRPVLCRPFVLHRPSVRPSATVVLHGASLRDSFVCCCRPRAARVPTSLGGSSCRVTQQWDT